jgi:hypothetical protein
MVSHKQARVLFTRLGTEPARVEEILADYPDPIDLTEAEPSLYRKYGISEERLMNRLGSSP